MRNLGLITRQVPKFGSGPLKVPDEENIPSQYCFSGSCIRATVFVNCAEEEWKHFVYQGHWFHWDDPCFYKNTKIRRFCNYLISVGLKLCVGCETQEEDKPLKFCAPLLLNKCITTCCSKMLSNVYCLHSTDSGQGLYVNKIPRT